MTTETSTAPTADEAPTLRYEPPLAPLTVPMYTKMLSAGVLDDVRVFLWEGRLAPRMTTGRPHTICVMREYHALFDLQLPGFFVEQEQPMAFRLAHSAPCPDVKLVRGRPNDYPYDLPTSAAVPIVVEVAESSLYDDRRKVRSYAGEGIPVSWIVNLIDRAIEVYTLAGLNTYGPPDRPGEDAEVPVTIDGTEVGRLRVRDLLP